jgi:hypothetical protein
MEKTDGMYLGFRGRLRLPLGLLYVDFREARIYKIIFGMSDTSFAYRGLEF